MSQSRHWAVTQRIQVSRETVTTCDNPMNPQLLKWTAAVALASAALGTTAQAQSADALIDKLVDK